MIHPLSVQLKASAAMTPKQLYWYYGPVVSNVQVNPIYYTGSSQISLQSSITDFYQKMSGSSYIAWLTEYYTGDDIGPGTLKGSINLQNAPSVVDDTAIQQLLLSLASQKKIQPNQDSYYPFHLGPGVDATKNGYKSCVGFCAYHGTVKIDGNYIPYSVIPDLTKCPVVCSGLSDPFQATTFLSSSLLAASIVNPGIGLMNSWGPPLGWVDPYHGEIGSMCFSSGATKLEISGSVFTVAKLWSNVQGACVVGSGSQSYVI
ncbi:hypothetical protein EDD86DRAFT_275513 [Gorgonomyces haynaldii]|nr:hypothetical protein EDD86DRAFT_275513 [Gorgonomyces haynaldii]